MRIMEPGSRLVSAPCSDRCDWSPLALPASPRSADTTARLGLVALSLTWGTTWPALKIAVDAIPPFSMRLGTSAIAFVALIAVAVLRGDSLRVRGGPAAWAHLVIAALLNVTALAVLTAFAQLVTSTSRVTVLTYTMPIWATLFAFLVLGERLTALRAGALALCVSGLLVLVYPLAGSRDLVGIALALITAVCWGAGTVYLKWARIGADPVALTVWQVVVTLAVTFIGVFLAEGGLHLWPVEWSALAALLFAALAGNALAYLLWFDIVRRLPATTASLGILCVPVVGVAGSMLLLGERPTIADFAGFALLLAAAGCVLLAPGGTR